MVVSYAENIKSARFVARTGMFLQVMFGGRTQFTLFVMIDTGEGAAKLR